MLAFNLGRLRGHKAKTTAEAIERLHFLNNTFLPNTYLPLIQKARGLASRVNEINRIAGESQLDIMQAFNSGDDLKKGVGDLQFAFREYEKCFSELAIAHNALAQTAKMYTKQLDSIL